MSVGTEMYDTFNNLNSSAKQINNMAKFKKFVDTNDDIKKKSNAGSYGYDVQMLTLQLLKQFLPSSSDAHQPAF